MSDQPADSPSTRTLVVPVAPNHTLACKLAEILKAHSLPHPTSLSMDPYTLTVTVYYPTDCPLYQEMLDAVREDHPTAVAINLSANEMGTITLEEPDE